MSAMETLEVPGPFTVDDLATMPDDGQRYEIIDGVLFVNAAPRPDHQGVLSSLLIALRTAAPDHLRVLMAPVDVVLSRDTVVEPDLLVAPRPDFTDTNLPTAPLLAVEVLSPSTRRVDLEVKKERYQRAGVPAYWVVDPAALTMTVFELVDHRYITVAEVSTDEVWTARQPFEVSIRPGDLRY